MDFVLDLSNIKNAYLSDTWHAQTNMKNKNNIIIGPTSPIWWSVPDDKQVLYFYVAWRRRFSVIEYHAGRSEEAVEELWEKPL